jgi:ribosome-associated heat shock protein Hsp15
VSAAPEKIRLDKWLWQARFFKTRSLSAKVVTGGHVRVNSTRVAKPAFGVAPGDVLTFPQARAVRVVRINALGDRRGPAPEAQALYEDLAPPDPASDRPSATAASAQNTPKYEGKGRPTKRDRRKLDANRPDTLD